MRVTGKMIIAVQGCLHGYLDELYESVDRLALERDVKVDLLICCGDFESLRNEPDLQCMACPAHHRKMGTFYKYYIGEVKAPLLTIFVGGNHEASNYLQELAYGGWVAPNIYYLGYAGVVNIGGIHIAGMSGLFKPYDYALGHFEKPPYTFKTLKSAYHIRELDVFRLKQLQGNVDIFMSHEWPRGIFNYGDTQEVLIKKPHFKDQMENDTLGCQAGKILIHELKPKNWFAAHMHCHFRATVEHNEHQSTNFLALEQCLPEKKFLEFVELPHDPKSLNFDLCYDPHWLAILKSTNNLLHIRPTTQYMPGPNSSSSERWNFYPTDEELQSVTKLFENDFRIPLNFQQTVKAYEPPPESSVADGPRRPIFQPNARINPQTTEFCQKLGIDDPFELLIVNQITS